MRSKPSSGRSPTGCLPSALGRALQVDPELTRVERAWFRVERAWFQRLTSIKRDEPLSMRRLRLRLHPYSSRPCDLCILFLRLLQPARAAKPVAAPLETGCSSSTNFAYSFNLRRYVEGQQEGGTPRAAQRGRFHQGAGSGPVHAQADHRNAHRYAQHRNTRGLWRKTGASLYTRERLSLSLSFQELCAFSPACFPPPCDF